MFTLTKRVTFALTLMSFWHFLRVDVGVGAN